MIRALALAALATGCVTIPAYQGNQGADADPNTPRTCDATRADVYHTTDRGHVLVCGPHFAMRFATTGFQYPDSFLIDGVEMLGTGDTCEDEQRLGVGVYPMGVVAAPVDGTAPIIEPANASIDFSIDSSFLVKLTTHWELGPTAVEQARCDEHLRGASDFVFSLDGHITRHDRIEHVDGTADADSTACGQTCTSASDPWYVTAYFAFPFVDDANHAITNFPDRPTQMGLSTSIDPMHTHYETCVSANATDVVGVGYAWNFGDNVARLRWVGPGTYALAHDILIAPNLGAYGSTNPLESRAIYLPARATGCGATETQLHAFGRIDATLDFNVPDPAFTTHTVPVGLANGDGIYASGGAVTAAEPVMRIVPFGGQAIPAGSAIWVHYAAHHEHWKVTFGVNLDEDITADVKTVVPIGAPDDVIFYFTRELPAGIDLAIAPTP